MSDAQPQRRPAWGRLGDELRDLRRRAGVGQPEMGATLGISKETVNRIETGGKNKGSPPSLRRVEQWIQACEIAQPDRAHLFMLASAALDEKRSYKDMGTVAEIQQGVRADEATARLLRNYDPWGIPGLLQTGDYAQAILRLAFPDRSDAEIAEGVAARWQRKEILYSPGHRFEFIVTAEGLRRPPASVHAQRVQLDQLATAITAEAVTFRILPPGSPMLDALPIGFVLYEERIDGADPFVAIEREDHRREQSTATEVVRRQAQYEAMSEGAITGDSAVEFIREVERSLS